MIEIVFYTISQIQIRGVHTPRIEPRATMYILSAHPAYVYVYLFGTADWIQALALSYIPQSCLFLYFGFLRQGLTV